MRQLLGLALLSAVSAPLRADIVYTCKDQDGGTYVTNLREEAARLKNCVQSEVKPNVVSPPAPIRGATVPAAPRNTDTQRSPEGFPKVAPQVQQQRDNDRKKILEAELINEQKLLQDARRELAEQENTRLGGERNAVRMQERIEPYARKVKLHEDNIANLQRELSNVR